MSVELTYEIPQLKSHGVYSRSGGMLARCVSFVQYLEFHPTSQKHLLVIESPKDRILCGKILTRLLSESVKVIQLVFILDILKYQESKSGIFIVSP